jgi:HEAT repeat protein
LGKIGTPAVKPLIALLKAPNVAIQGPQSDAFTLTMASGRVVEIEDSGVQGRAARALGKTKDPRAVDSLIEALKDRNAGVRFNAANALGEIGDARAVDPLIAAVRDAKIGSWAASALGAIGAPGIAPLIAALKDSDGNVRRNAAIALGGIKDPSAAGALLSALRKRDIEVVAEIHYFYINQGEPGSEDALIEALNRFGNKGMAESYLNCGNGRLAQAAREWATRNGYRIVTTSGGGAAQWGSAR